MSINGATCILNRENVYNRYQLTYIYNPNYYCCIRIGGYGKQQIMYILFCLTN